MSTFIEQLQLGEYSYIRWRVKEYEEEGNVCIPAAGFVRLASQISKEIKKWRFWVSPTLSKGKAYGDDELLIDLWNDDTG
jgi:hypothetical protein